MRWAPLSETDQADIINKIDQSFKSNFNLLKRLRNQHVNINIDEDSITIESNVKLEYSEGPIEIELSYNEDKFEHTAYINIEFNGKFSYTNSDDKNLDNFRMHDLNKLAGDWEMETYDRKFYDNL